MCCLAGDVGKLILVLEFEGDRLESRAEFIDGFGKEGFAACDLSNLVDLVFDLRALRFEEAEETFVGNALQLPVHVGF